MGYGNSKEFPYELKESDNNFSGNSIFTLHHGISKEDGSPVSIFRFEKTDLSEVENASKRLKLIRHPNILRYITSVDLPNAYFIVTEPIKSIYECINEIRKYPDWCAWGLSQIITALDFLGSKQCQLVHCNINFNSIFITKSGDWKLGGMEFVGEPLDKYPFLNEKEKYLNSIQKLYRPPESLSASAWKGPNFAFDSYQMAAFIFQVYNVDVVPNNSSLSNQNIPKTLVQQFTKLSNSNPSGRITLSHLLTSPFFDNPLIVACTFIENINLKETNEKDAFFKSLEPLVDSVPAAVCKYKFLPLLVRALDFGSANSKVLGPILKIGTLLTPEEYSEHVTPSVAKWFESPDRNLRVNLLQNLSSFADHLPRDLINSKIFPHIAQGFLDTNETIRELTVISIVHIISKLDERHISTQLLKSLAKLQIDPIAKIRTNTTICLGKISPYIPKQQRQQVLIPAFLRSLQDPFLHARLAGILSLSATHQYYTKEEVAKRLIPGLAQLTIDPELKVRQASFATLKNFILKLENISENGEQPESEEQTESQASSMFGWVSSKFYGGTSKPSVELSSTPPSSTPNKPANNNNNNNNNNTPSNNNNNTNNNAKITNDNKLLIQNNNKNNNDNKNNNNNNNNNNVIKDDYEDNDWQDDDVDWKDVNEGDDDDDWGFSAKKVVAEKVKEKEVKNTPKPINIKNQKQNDNKIKEEKKDNKFAVSNEKTTQKGTDWGNDWEDDEEFADFNEPIPQPKKEPIKSPSVSAKVSPTPSLSLSLSPSPSPSSSSSKLAVQPITNKDDNNERGGGWGDWNDDFDEPFVDNTTKNTKIVSSNNIKKNENQKSSLTAPEVSEGDGWGDNEDFDDWSKPIPTSSPKENKTEKTSVKAPVKSTPKEDDNWDNFGKPVEKKLSKIELANLKREQKKTAGKKT